jgi:hypothetical protein
MSVRCGICHGSWETVELAERAHAQADVCEATRYHAFAPEIAEQPLHVWVLCREPAAETDVIAVAATIERAKAIAEKRHSLGPLEWNQWDPARWDGSSDGVCYFEAVRMEVDP